MTNLYEQSQETNYRQLKCDELLFVEYQCLPGEEPTGIWSQHGHFIYGMSGMKKWITHDQIYTVTQGDALYCQKGSHYVQQFGNEGFCALLFFIPESFIQETILEYKTEKRNSGAPKKVSHILALDVDVTLRCFFESVISFFFLENHPSPALLKLKFKELILQILTERKHALLAHHFFTFGKSDEVNLKLIMENNFLFNLQLEDYAKLCNRSLSSFKRDFQKIFECSPGKWLTDQRLKYARIRLVTKNESINDIAFHSGFESSSHFIRSFKQHFGLPPLQYRDKSRL